MTNELLDSIHEALSKGKKGTAKKYLDQRIEIFSESKELADDFGPLAEKTVSFLWTVRKVADLDEGLALACFEDGFAIADWLLRDFTTRLKDIGTH